eukprot:XP_014071697.1 PREDICTED: 39S ribosomal protein L54, mitochondrial-like isoform X3 [Salmo salar]
MSRLEFRTMDPLRERPITGRNDEKGKCIVKDVLKGPELCKDPVKLTSHAVGVNILKQGDDPALKPHKEYPEWLFQLQLGPLKNIHKLEPDSREYWKVLRKEHVVL